MVWDRSLIQDELIVSRLQLPPQVRLGGLKLVIHRLFSLLLHAAKSYQELVGLRVVSQAIMSAVLRYRIVSRPLDVLRLTQHVILRVHSEIASAALGLALALVPHMIHHRGCHARAPKSTLTQLYSGACKQVSASL